MSQARTESVPTWTLGWRLQRSLSFAELSVQDMADELGVSRGTISRWCNDHGTPSRGYLKLWALRTGVPFEWLTEGDQGDSGRRPAGIRRDGSSEQLACSPSISEVLSFQKRIPLQSPVGL